MTSRSRLRSGVTLALAASALLPLYLAITGMSPRGLVMTVTPSSDWTGPALSSERVRHLAHGPERRPTERALPDRHTVSYDGFLYVPRSGDYAFAVDASDSAWLSVAGLPVLTHRRGRPPTRGEVTLRQGLHPLRLRVDHRSGASDLSLDWRPPGAWAMAPLNPVFLHPALPTPEGDSHALLLIAVGLLALAAAIGVGPEWRARWLAIPTSERRFAAMAFVLLPAVLFALWLPAVLQAGETRDEWLTALTARTAVSSLVHGYVHYDYWQLGNHQPPAGLYLYGLVMALVQSSDLVVLRLTSAFCSAAALGVAAWALRPVSSRFVSVLTVLLAGTVPAYAHAHAATLDGPGHLAFVVAAVSTLRLFRMLDPSPGDAGRPPPTGREFVRTGLFVGVAAAVRLSNLLLLALGLLLHFHRVVTEHRRRGVTTLPLALLVVPPLVLVVVFLSWPWLWLRPFGHGLAISQTWDYSVTELFLGAHTAPPLGYLPVQLLLNGPPLLLVAAALAVVRLRSADAGVLYWAATPLLAAFTRLEADGARHLLPLWLPLSALAAIGVERWSRAGPARRVACLAVVAHGLWANVSVFPYPTAYRSELVGAAALSWQAELAPSAYLGEGLETAAQAVNALPVDARTTWTYDGASVHLAEHLIRPSLARVTEGGDILIQTSPPKAQLSAPGYWPLDTVAVDGAALVSIHLRVGSTVYTAYRAQSGEPQPGDRRPGAPRGTAL
ncbi:MAG: hypothetical protein IV100_31385 [Myxococcales bacterium]|nr:hypothetical protein [Myxococcales bacterium]